MKQKQQKVARKKVKKKYKKKIEKNNMNFKNKINIKKD